MALLSEVYCIIKRPAKLGLINRSALYIKRKKEEESVSKKGFCDLQKFEKKNHPSIFQRPVFVKHNKTVLLFDGKNAFQGLTKSLKKARMEKILPYFDFFPPGFCRGSFKISEISITENLMRSLIGMEKKSSQKPRTLFWAALPKVTFSQYFLWAAIMEEKSLFSVCVCLCNALRGQKKEKISGQKIYLFFACSTIH